MKSDDLQWILILFIPGAMPLLVWKNVSVCLLVHWLLQKGELVGVDSDMGWAQGITFILTIELP
jgi:hypothetical protein